ncbi:hypothetical protein TTRE_0000944801 [Trichuris trichiura]|uniref:Uncharacterized protein n=1 Tax=Trichuris trichiura TaxID=36087 RepID=A0A077ZMQ8_TRITR|nr:hypothetical protein TTRE_0000944801 [Trichuris trichiura]
MKQLLAEARSTQKEGLEHRGSIHEPTGDSLQPASQTEPLARSLRNKRVIVTPAVYPRLVEFLHFDIQSTGQKSHCVNTDHRPSQCFVLIIQSDSSCPCHRLFNAGRSGLSRAGQAHTAEVVRAQASLPTAASEEAPRLRVADVRQQRRGADKPRARSRPAGENATPGKRSSSDRQSATAPNTLRSISPTGSALRANPCSEGTDPFCRLPLSALFNWPEAVHLGDLLRIWVRASTNLYGLGFSRTVESVPNATGDAAFCGDIVAISGQPGSSDCVPYEEKKTLSGTADGCSPSSEALPRAPVPRASSRANRADSGDEAPRPRKRQPETRVYIFVSRFRNFNRIPFRTVRRAASYGEQVRNDVTPLRLGFRLVLRID